MEFLSLIHDSFNQESHLTYKMHVRLIFLFFILSYSGVK